MKNSRLMTLVFALIIVVIFSFSSIVSAQDGCNGDDPVSGDPAETGQYSSCSYSFGLSDSDYSDAEVFYPCETESGPFAATTLTGGYTNTYSDMAWLYNHLVTHGYVIIAMTPNNTLGTNSQWTQAHKAGIDKLINENSRSASPINGLVNTGKLQIMGFSKGGGGALLASDDLGSRVQSTQALAPYMDFSYNLSGIDSPTICHTGTSDSIASPGNVVDMYNSLPDGIERTLAYFNNVSHTDWYGSSGSYRDRMKTYITSWMKFYLDGDAHYETYLNGAEHEDHMAEGWFNQYVRNQDAGGAGGCN